MKQKTTRLHYTLCNQIPIRYTLLYTRLNTRLHAILYARLYTILYTILYTARSAIFFILPPRASQLNDNTLYCAQRKKKYILPPRASQLNENILYYLREPPGYTKIFYTTSASLPAGLPVLLLTRDHETTRPRVHEGLEIQSHGRNACLENL